MSRYLRLGLGLGSAAALFGVAASAYPKLEKLHEKVAPEQASQPIVDHDKWVEARKKLLEQEKQLTRHVDQVIALRRQMPWEEVKTDYVFQSTTGPVHLSQFFQGDKKDLIVYHLMFSDKDEKACPNCSLWNDGFNGYFPHVKQRASFVAVARANASKLNNFAKLKGWSFPVVSSEGTTFNKDFGVENPAAGGYNYGSGWPYPVSDYPGVSIFRKGSDGKIYHTYSTYARGLDQLNGCHALFDLLPEGRNGFRFQHKESYPK